MATADTSALPSPLLEEWPAAKDALQAVDTHLVQDQLSLQRYLAQQQAQAMGSHAHVCEWVPTNLRLPSQDAQQDIYLCLPAHLSEASYFKQNEEKEESKDDGYCSSTTTKLRLMELDRYLSIVTPLALSTEKLLSGSSNCREGITTPQIKNPCRRSKYDRQWQLPMHASDCTLHHLITSTNSGRVLNVLQGEIAHCTPSQAETLVSDDSTTCHIVALRSHYVDESETIEAASDRVLASMAHIDGPGYEDSIRGAVYEHAKYHSMQMKYTLGNQGEECKESLTSQRGGRIEMSIHIMGGFNDEEGSSIEITDNILQTFAALSNECHSSHGRLPLRMTLETCAVASANDDGTCCPIGRGLAMEVATGRIFLAEVEAAGMPPSSSNTNTGCISAEGPAATLRSTRLWASAFHPCRSNQGHRLHIIHYPNSDHLCIEPFFYGPHPAAIGLLCCSDQELLQLTSTSPKVEKPNFASKVRQSLAYMNCKAAAQSPFGTCHDMPLIFQRVGLNGWERTTLVQK